MKKTILNKKGDFIRIRNNFINHIGDIDLNQIETYDDLMTANDAFLRAINMLESNEEEGLLIIKRVIGTYAEYDKANYNFSFQELINYRNIFACCILEEKIKGTYIIAFSDICDRIMAAIKEDQTELYDYFANDTIAFLSDFFASDLSLTLAEDEFLLIKALMLKIEKHYLQFESRIEKNPYFNIVADFYLVFGTMLLRYDAIDDINLRLKNILTAIITINPDNDKDDSLLVNAIYLGNGIIPLLPFELQGKLRDFLQAINGDDYE